MKTSDILLLRVRLEEIHGKAFSTEGEPEVELRVLFRTKVVTDLEGIKKGDVFEARLYFSAHPSATSEPDFSIEVAGDFKILDEHVIKELTADPVAFEAASLLFPYVRSLAKPILENLGTANIEFPFHLPPPPSGAEGKPGSSKRKPRAKTKPKESTH
jgi:preprotein translocase subunit SecB|tara:strand:- start:345 stop:818 length:474 start_codon:yes stop_codon:yes gene_type:complete